MTREDAVSGAMLLLMCLAFWLTGFDGKAPGAPGEPRIGASTAQQSAPEFGSGCGAFRVAVPSDWVWERAEESAADPAGWRREGRFVGSDTTLQVDWRRLDREVRVEDWIRYECRMLRLSESRLYSAEGRRPRTVCAEVWDEEGGTRRSGCLGVAKLGDRLYRLWARLAPEAPPGALRVARDVVTAIQPLGSVASTCAEELTTWRPFFASPLAVPYPSSWLRVDGPAWREHPMLHLRSRVHGRCRGAMLLCALDARDVETELSDARLEELLGQLAERERGLALTSARVWVDTDCDSERMGGPGRLRIVRLSHEGEEWEVRLRVLVGKEAALVLVLATPEKDADPLAWMIHRAAFDLTAEEAREE